MKEEGEESIINQERDRIISDEEDWRRVSLTREFKVKISRFSNLIVTQKG